MFRFIEQISKKALFYGLLAVVLVVMYFFSFSDTAKRSETFPEGNFEVTFVDVGQGSSVLMRTPNGGTILFDGGESEKYDTNLKPYLESCGIETVDTAIVSHFHSDHMGGIGELLKEGRIKKLILPGYPAEADEIEFWTNQAEKTNTEFEYAVMGDSIDGGYQELKIDVLNPPAEGIQSSSYDNDNSLVLRVTYGKTVLLLAGDVEAKAESGICDTDQNITCEVLQVPHHGSSSSTTKEFLDRTDPVYTVIQCGEDNRYGHPHYETLDSLQDEDAQIYRNDKDGNITFTISPEKITSVACSK